MTKTDEENQDYRQVENEMPKKGKKRHGLQSMSDITLHDFADCPRPQSCGRVKKSVVNVAVAGAILKTSNAEKVLEKEDEDLSWFEKDLENFVIEDPSNEEGEDEEGTQTIKVSLDVKDKSRSEKTTCGGVTYPQDLWFLVSDYVLPEDIGTFSRICKGAHSVTLTVAFWRRLYDRLAVKVKDGLPSHVRPHRMERLHGLRARVIRSLFFLHPALTMRVQGRGPMEDEPHCLKGHRCLLAWHQPATKGWQFCFKFQKPSLRTLASYQRPASKLDVYHGYNDLCYNPEEGCSVLQVTCCHFASVASVMGLLLSQVYVTLSSGFRHHRLRLHFDSSVSVSHNLSDLVVVLDDVISIKVMRWWHPAYPFTS